jgi:hypothetical protein
LGARQVAKSILGRYRVAAGGGERRVVGAARVYFTRYSLDGLGRHPKTLPLGRSLIRAVLIEIRQSIISALHVVFYPGPHLATAVHVYVLKTERVQITKNVVSLEHRNDPTVPLHKNVSR